VFDEDRDYSIADPDVGLKPRADAGKIYSAGIAYTFGKLEVSAGYFKSLVKFSDNEKSQADIISLAAEYKFDKALRLYFEYDNISTDTCARAQAYKKACDLSPTGKNKANIFMVGSKINF
jgi:predicted porin